MSQIVRQVAPRLYILGAKTMTLDQLSAAATWLRQCHDWMMTNDLDMQCPMETSPEDIAISLEAIIENMTSPGDKVEVLFAYCCAEAGGRVAYCDCVKKAHGTVFLPEKQVGDHTRTGQLVAVADDAVERVARAMAPRLEGGREFDQMPANRRELKIWSRNGMAMINDATQEDAIEAATVALAAMKGTGDE